MLLRTDRLILRPCTAADVDVLLELWREPDVRRYLLDDHVVTRDEAAGHVAGFLQSADERGLFLWLAEAPDDSRLAGFVALRLIDGTDEVEVYYGLAPRFWGQGLATEAARAVVDYGFKVLELPRIWARTDAPNTASVRVAKRLNMQPAADPGATSFVSFVIAREDWPA
jgi:ribosomal-protein-alanine N-acetyltransferase